MDPLLDYYLCTQDDETIMVAAYWWDEAALEGFDSVQKLPYWQAMQLTVGPGDWAALLSVSRRQGRDRFRSAYAVGSPCAQEQDHPSGITCLYRVGMWLPGPGVTVGAPNMPLKRSAVIWHFFISKLSWQQPVNQT